MLGQDIHACQSDVSPPASVACDPRERILIGETFLGRRLSPNPFQELSDMTEAKCVARSVGAVRRRLAVASEPPLRSLRSLRSLCTLWLIRKRVPPTRSEFSGFSVPSVATYERFPPIRSDAGRGSRRAACVALPPTMAARESPLGTASLRPGRLTLFSRDYRARTPICSRNSRHVATEYPNGRYATCAHERGADS